MHAPSRDNPTSFDEMPVTIGLAPSSYAVMSELRFSVRQERSSL